MPLMLPPPFICAEMVNEMFAFANLSPALSNAMPGFRMGVKNWKDLSKSKREKLARLMMPIFTARPGSSREKAILAAVKVY